MIEYTLDTQRARSEARVQPTQARLVNELVKRASNEANRDPQIGRTLFQLLVPVEVEPFLGGAQPWCCSSRPHRAFPWELLDTATPARRRAACVNSGRCARSAS
jgi:hypothetical protein